MTEKEPEADEKRASLEEQKIALTQPYNLALQRAYIDTIWMARRYAAGRHTHAPRTVERHIQNVEKICGIKIEPDHTIVEDAGVTLVDQHPDYKTQCKVGIVEDNNIVSVEFEGYNNCGTCDSAEFGKGQQTIVGFEIWEGELRCLVWADINQEDPTHIIGLDDAKIIARTCDYCGGKCPSDHDHACDGFIGDIDDLYAPKG